MFEDFVSLTAQDNTQPTRMFRSFESIEQEIITKAISFHGGNMSHVAVALGISRTTLYSKVRKYNIRRSP